MPKFVSQFKTILWDIVLKKHFYICTILNQGQNPNVICPTNKYSDANTVLHVAAKTNSW